MLAAIALSPPVLLAGEAARSHPAEGVYFLRQPGRVLHLTRDEFRSVAYEPQGRRPVEACGLASMDRGRLHVQYFDGKCLRRVETTAAVADGHLWIGVLSRVQRPNGEDEWQYICTDPEVFALDRRSLPAQRIVWSNDTWWFYPDGEILKKRLAVKGVRRVYPDRAEWKDDRFLLRFGNAPEARALLDRVPKSWLTEDEAARKDGALPQERELTLGWCMERPEAIITPWSIDLGPAGLVPQRTDRKAVGGTWISQTDQEETVTFGATEEARARFAWAAMLGRRPDTRAAVRRMLTEGSAFFDPDVHGISHTITGWDCCMGHVDTPFHIHWLMLEDGRLVRHISQGGCMGGSRGRGVEFFQKGPPNKTAAADGR